MRFDYLRKFLLITGAALSVSIVSVQNLQAQVGATGGTATAASIGAQVQTEQNIAAAALAGVPPVTAPLFPPTQGTATSEIPLLQAIANNTYGLLVQINSWSTGMVYLGQMAQAWITADTSPETSGQLVPNFIALGTVLNANLATQLSLQLSPKTSINNAFFTNPGTNAVSLPTNANDLVYATLLGGTLPFKETRNPKPNSPYNYILNASGANIVHVIPGASWQGAVADQIRYQNYYNTAIAVESYNAYVLSNQYADKNQFNTTQTALITLASDQQNWMALVASENIGWVLRQMLLFQSQSFVLLTQLVQYEKQIATASAMTNALILTLNQQWEENFVAKAQGTNVQ